MRRIILATYSPLVFFLPFVFSPTTSELFELPKFVVLLTAAIVIGTIYGLELVETRGQSFTLGRYPLLTYAVLGVLATQALATATSIHPFTSFWGYYSRFHQGLLSTLAYTILYLGALRYLNFATATRLLKLSLVAALIISALAVLERFNVSLTCPSIQYVAGKPIVFNNTCWKVNTNPGERSFATLGQPNWLAAYLLPHLFVLLSTFFSHKKRTPTSYLLTSLFYLLILAALFLTKSRSGHLALGASLLVYLFLSYQPLKLRIQNLLYVLLPPIIGLVLLYLPVKFAIPTPLPSPTPVASPPPELEMVESTASSQIRQIVWRGSLALIQSHPFLGTGPETFAYTYYAARPVEHNYTTEWDFLYNKAHNEYLNIAATTGLLGLLGYLIWHGAILRLSLLRPVRSKKVNQEAYLFFSPFLPVLAATLTSFAITNFFGFSVVPVYLTLTLFAAYANLAPTDSPTPLRLTLGYLVPVLSLVLLFLFPLRLYLSDHAYNLGKSLLSKNQAVSARPYLERAVGLWGSNPLYHALLAEIEANLGNSAQALQSIDRNRALDAVHLNFYKSRAKSYITLAGTDPAYYRPAADELITARTLAPTDPKLAYNLGLIYSRLGDGENSIREMQEAIELKRDYYEPYYALTLLYESTKQEKLIPDLLKQAQDNLKSIPEPLQNKVEKYLD